MFAVSKDTLRLLRVPFSLYLAPVFLLALSQAPFVNVFTAITSFCIIHLLVYPASNGYNSYVDKDTGSIGGLENPPMPGIELYYLTLLLDILAVVLSLLCVSALFALCVALYIAASRAYSAPAVRLKKYAFTGFMVVVLFQGAITCYMAMAGISGQTPVVDKPLLLLMLACTLQIAGAYPLTQVYQHTDDRLAGTRTISMVLGIRGTFVFTIVMFALCTVVYFFYFFTVNRLYQFYMLLLFFLPLVGFFSWWFLQVLKNESAANFRNTMSMNLVSALCTGACFILFIFL